MNPQDTKAWLEKLDQSINSVNVQVAGLTAKLDMIVRQHTTQIGELFRVTRDHHDRPHVTREEHETLRQAVEQVRLRMATWVGAAMVIGMILGGLLNFGLGYLLREVTA